jgi:predicted  nucleic acid-binding Zn-ribbon protein
LGGLSVDNIKSVADLLDLQEIDLKIDRLLDTRSSLDELDEYKAAHAKVEGLDQEKAEAAAALKSASMGLSKSDGELEILAEKAASEQNRLYAGGMSARDADYVRREVEMLYAKVSKMEDDVLEFIELKEEAEARLDGLTEDLVGASSERDELRESITEQWRVIDKELAMKEERKSDAVASVDEYLLEIYAGLRESNEGRVVGKLIDGVCGSCHLKLSAAEEARAVKDDPPRCIHCRSILVA